MDPEKAYKTRYWAEINLDNLVYNFKLTQETFPNLRIMTVVKADAYGHGAVPVARALEEAGSTYFGVATADEAIQLRRGGIQSPILVLGMVHSEDILRLAEQNITITIGDDEVFSYKKALGDRKIKAHFCINTGMNRIGLKASGAVLQIKRLMEYYDCFEFEGIWTHFPAADDPKQNEFTLHQIELFDGIVEALAADGIEIPLRHYANSDALVHFTDTHYRATRTDINMARPGTILYGQGRYQLGGKPVKPVIELKACLMKKGLVLKGESVSYSRTWYAERDSMIGTIGVGYGDGLSTLFSNKLTVIGKGLRMPQVGRITMDQCMFDATDAPHLVSGNTITIVGTDGGETNTVDDVADIIGAICTEITTTLGKRMPRLYYKNGKLVDATNYIEKL